MSDELRDRIAAVIQAATDNGASKSDDYAQAIIEDLGLVVEKRIDIQATDGPWEADLASQEGAIPDVIWHDGVYGTMERQDAEFIAEARTRFPQAVAALRAVIELHRPCHDAHGWTPCQECEQPWPCQTMQELDATLGLEGDDDDNLG